MEDQRRWEEKMKIDLEEIKYEDGSYMKLAWESTDISTSGSLGSTTSVS
jgi:hypothetical protein